MTDFPYRWKDAIFPWTDERAQVPWTDFNAIPGAAISDLRIGKADLTAADVWERMRFMGPIGWGKFASFSAGEYTYQNALHRLVMLSTGADRPRITSLKLTVDVPDVLDRGETVLSAVETFVPFNKMFLAPPEIVAMQKSGTVIARVDVGTVTTEGFYVTLLDGDGSPVAGTISWTAAGY